MVRIVVGSFWGWAPRRYQCIQTLTSSFVAPLTPERTTHVTMPARRSPCKPSCSSGHSAEPIAPPRAVPRHLVWRYNRGSLSLSTKGPNDGSRYSYRCDVCCRKAAVDGRRLEKSLPEQW